MHPFMSGLVGHLIDIGFCHVPSICVPPQATDGGISKTFTDLFSLPWLSHCVEVSLLLLCGCHRGCLSRWKLACRAQRLAFDNFLFLSLPGLLVRLSVRLFWLCLLWGFRSRTLACYSGYACECSNMMTLGGFRGPCHFLPSVC